MKVVIWAWMIGMGLAVVWLLVRVYALEVRVVWLIGRIDALEGRPRATSLGLSAGPPEPKA